MVVDESMALSMPRLTSSIMAVARSSNSTLLLERNKLIHTSTEPEQEDCVSRQWTFEYKIPIPEEENLVISTTNSEKELPENVRELLQVAACLESFDKTLVRAVLQDGDDDKDDVQQRYAKAVELGLIVHYQPNDEQYAFLNAETRNAAYNLIPEEERAQHHVSVGRKLARNLSPDEMETYISTIIHQFQQGMEELSSAPKERHAVASLCRQAAQQAVAESNFQAAHDHLDFGITLLLQNNDSWKSDYQLTLALYNAAAEVEYCLANFERMDTLVKQVLEHAVCFRDSVLARATRVYSLGGRGRTVEAVEEGLDILKQLGVCFPKRTRKWHVAMELLRAKKLLRGKTNEMILRMPYMKNEDMICSMQMLNLVFPNVFKTDPYLAFLVSSRMVTLSLQHGLSAISSVGFSMFGTMFCAYTSDKDEGYRFGQLGLALLDRFGAREWLPRVYFSVYGNINRQRDRMQELIGPLHHGYIVGMETGDIEFAMLNASLHVAFMLFGGPSLPALEAQALEYISVMESHQQVSAMVKTRSILQFVQNLMGKTDNPLYLHSDTFDDDIASPRANNLLTVWCHFQKMILRYLLSDYDGAEQEAVLFRSLRKYLHFKSSFGFISLLEGLALLAVCNDRPRNVRRRHLAVVRGNIKQLQKESLYNPHDIAGKVFLLEAELARVMGKNDLARYQFVCAMAVTRDSGVVLDHAIACERTSRYMMSIGETAAAAKYLRQSKDSYGEWGASIKVQQLEKELSSSH